jgi:uncharacterized OB-fold protein
LQDFLDCLRKGEFLLPVCVSCHAKVWPPSKLCPHCFSHTSLEKIELVGTLVEFAESNIKNKNGKFGVIELDGITLIAGLQANKLAEGMKMKLAACGIQDDGTPYYDFEPYETGH